MLIDSRRTWLLTQLPAGTADAPVMDLEKTWLLSVLPAGTDTNTPLLDLRRKYYAMTTGLAETTPIIDLEREWLLLGLPAGTDETKPVYDLRDLYYANGGVPSQPAARQVVLDANGDGDYTTFADANAYLATVAAEATPYELIIKPGTYTEAALPSGAIVDCVAYVTYRGEDAATCILQEPAGRDHSDESNPVILVKLAIGCNLINLTLQGDNAIGGINNLMMVRGWSVHDVNISGCRFLGAQWALNLGLVAGGDPANYNVTFSNNYAEARNPCFWTSTHDCKMVGNTINFDSDDHGGGEPCLGLIDLTPNAGTDNGCYNCTVSGNVATLRDVVNSIPSQGFTYGIAIQANGNVIRNNKITLTTARQFAAAVQVFANSTAADITGDANQIADNVIAVHSTHATPTLFAHHVFRKNKPIPDWTCRRITITLTSDNASTKYAVYVNDASTVTGVGHLTADDTAIITAPTYTNATTAAYISTLDTDRASLGLTWPIAITAIRPRTLRLTFTEASTTKTRQTDELRNLEAASNDGVKAGVNLTTATVQFAGATPAWITLNAPRKLRIAPTGGNFSGRVIGWDAQGRTIVEDFVVMNGEVGYTVNAFRKIWGFKVMATAAAGTADVGFVDKIGLFSKVSAVADIVSIAQGAANPPADPTAPAEGTVDATYSIVDSKAAITAGDNIDIVYDGEPVS